MAALTQPVAGPCCIKLFYNFVVFCVFVWFIVCVQAAAPTWNAPMVEVQAKFVQELRYPDVYMCIPPLGMSTIIQEQLDYTIMGLEKPKSTSTVCRGFSEMTRVRVSLTMDQDYVACQSQVGVSDINAITNGYINTNEVPPSDSTQIPPTPQSNPFFKKANEITGGNPFLVNEVAANLAASLGTYKDPINPNAQTYNAFCFFYNSTNLTAKYDSNNVLMHVNALKLNLATAAELLYMNAYFVPSGKLPYKKVGDKFVATATSVLWPLKNSLTQGQLSTEIITDTSTLNKRLSSEERVYSDEPTIQYKVSVNSQPTRLTVFDDAFEVDDATNRGNLQMIDSVVYGGNSLRFGTFVQQNIMIRDKTYAEIWAEIGGLWAGCCIAITLLFKSSGYTTDGVPEEDQEPGAPLLVPRFIPGGMVKKHLAAYRRKKGIKSDEVVSPEPEDPSEVKTEAGSNEV
jgi:hypothetical protein